MLKQCCICAVLLLNLLALYSGTAQAEIDLNAVQKLLPDDYRTGISISVDGNTAVIGTKVYSSSDPQYVYIFTRSYPGDTWTLQQSLAAPDDVNCGESGDRFGSAVSVDGDTVAIGVPDDNNYNGEYAGSVYIFTRTDNIWSFQQKIVPDDGTTHDTFGYSVSVDGDTVVVGANHNVESPGAAYVFTRSGNIWTQQQKLVGDVSNYFGFGTSVSLDADTVVIGSVDDGSAYVFTRTGDIWSLQQKITPTGESYGNYFGFSVSLDGNSVVIGSLADNDWHGSAYVFTRSGSVWSLQQKLAADDSYVYNMFGQSVSIDGDTVIIGAPGQQSDFGSAYVFTRSGSVWGQQQKITAYDSEANDYFGYSVAVDGESVAITTLNGNSLAYIYSQPAVYGDSDNDGITDADDQCSATASGDAVNASGCSVAQLCPCGGGWKNRSKYVQCVKQAAGDFLAGGLITTEQKKSYVSAANRSTCGGKK